MARLDRSVISGLPIFAGLAPEQLDDVLAEVQSIRFAKRASVFEQGQEELAFFALLHGRLRVAKLTPDGHQVLVRFVLSGEIFGVAGAIGRAIYPASASAVVHSVVLV
ncbi:MAG TPA: cyclic nucleotide-binding domain-containing protein, partial [Beijerinckiaceae bacterium]|nr:cyclic nucleotide-binding domain-containing protein [Beijerinckiaceae bacterium]